MKKIFSVISCTLFIIALSIVAFSAEIDLDTISSQNIWSKDKEIKYVTDDNLICVYNIKLKDFKFDLAEDKGLFYSDIQSISQSSSNLEYFIKNDGTLWQYNIDGNIDICKQVEDIANCVKVSNGDDYTIALLSDGTVWAWGKNTYGQLGNGTNEDCSAPQKIDTLSNIVDISAGHSFAMALDSDGNAYAWGSNKDGQLANGYFSADEENHDANLPCRIRLSEKCIQIAAGNSMSAMLTSDNRVYVCGYMIRPKSKYYRVEKQQLEIEDCIQMSIFNDKLLILTDRGKVYQYGAIYPTTDSKMSELEEISGLENIKKVVAGDYNCFINTDNEIIIDAEPYYSPVYPISIFDEESPKLKLDKINLEIKQYNDFTDISSKEGTKVYSKYSLFRLLPKLLRLYGLI